MSVKKIVNLWNTISPFIQEWLFTCFKWSFVSVGLFLLAVILKIFFDFFPEDSWLTIIRLFLLFTLSICAFITIVLPLPRQELLDCIKRYPLIKMKMSLAAIDTFHTSLPTDYIPTVSTEINDHISESESYSYPLLIRGCSLSDHFVFRSSLRNNQLSFATAYDGDINDMDDPSMLFVTNNMKLTTDQKTMYCYKLRLLADLEVINKLDDLITLEPTMEFQVTFLQHSHLILRLEPIENCLYDEKVFSLLQEINERIHPWIRRDLVHLLSERKISKYQNRMAIKNKLTRPDIKEDVVEKGKSDIEINQILDEYRKKKESE